jgi:hypothetical protein
MTVIPKARPRDDPDKWLMDIIYFLSQGVPPEELSKAERKRLGVRSHTFGLMNGSSTTNPRMEYGDVWYGRMSKRMCCENAIV